MLQEFWIAVHKLCMKMPYTYSGLGHYNKPLVDQRNCRTKTLRLIQWLKKTCICVLPFPADHLVKCEKNRKLNFFVKKKKKKLFKLLVGRGQKQFFFFGLISGLQKQCNTKEM